jgi:glycosyltransferase involved in cell wall biosynthesis
VFYTPNGASFLSATNKFSRYFYQLIEKMGHRFGGKVVCCSASELEEYLKLGIDAGYINNGIQMINNITIAAKKPGDKFRIVTSGRIEVQKNPALFNSIATYFEEFSQIEFIWIGDGIDRNLFTAKNITITGWLDNSAVHDCITASDLYISTSLYEGLSFATLEALALKKPVLLSNCTGNTDLVKKGINGGLFNTAPEAIIKIWQYFNNQEMLPVMGEFSKEICTAEFDVKQNYKTYRELYTGLLKNAGHTKARWSLGY